ncbi:M48 family metalloprotease [Parvularcula lutaonensis]|uniref:M48 family metalloprotease n=1 Tax=Parvularcula lutaonensis TaxID=491923 RepID=A0ABV7M960_9PROT|nr:M48 family metalloprotease [Parvularcula lutaonensis]
MFRWRSFVLLFAGWAFFCAQASAQVLLRDAEIEEWLYDMSEPLWQVAGLPDGSVEILLIGDPTPNAFAGASSGLKMGIHTGLITLADTPNEVEGVIAHETGHLAGGHSARTAEAMAKASKPRLLGLMVGAALLAAGAPAGAGLTAMGLGQAAALDTYLGYSRGQESAADQAGLTYLDEVGSSARGLLDFFDVLKNQQLIRANQPQPYFQTHPLAVQRVARLRNRAEASPYWDERDSPEEIAKLRLIQAKIHGFLNDPNVTLRMYPLTDQSDAARYARAVAYYRSSDLPAAMREIDRLLADYPDNPYYYELKGQMLFEHGKAADAIAPHRTSAELAPQHALLKINLARALVATDRDENVAEAIGILEEALRLERDNGFAWAVLARARSHQGDDTLALLAQAEAEYHSNDPVAAHRFASLAKDKLTVGTPEHQQALDIIVATAEIAQQARRQPRRR